MTKGLFAALFLVSTLSLSAQAPGNSQFHSLEALDSFPIGSSASLSIQTPALTFKPFTVMGPRGALLGQQNGTYEAWIFPWKILSDMRITAQMKDYAVPIDVNEQAATLDVQPDHTTITFSHANFTIREILITPQTAPEGAGALVLYQIEAVRPLTLTFSFTPEMKPMWPAPSDNRPSAEWVQTGTSGFYILHLDSPGHAGALAMPQAEPGILPPYQERPKIYPLQFVLHFDPARDSKKFFPLLMAIGENEKETSATSFHERLAALQTSFVSLYTDTQSYYRSALAQQTSIETPDAKLNEAFRWAEVAIEQLRVETTPTRGETALVAGFYASGDSSRPGFGWYFGRDSLWTLYAINSYGDFKLSRDEFEFLMHRQRADGKMPHEWSQTADLVDWKALPYEYASADGTLLFLMAMDDYLRVSGDKAFIEKNWDSLQRAWTFATSHDSDGDGIYENTEGTGWVESWPPGMPHQEIYLASLYRQASTAMAHLSQTAGHADVAKDADSRAQHISDQIEKEYLLPGGKFYAFSRNADGTTDNSPTIYPAVAAWDGTYNLKQMQPVLNRWASSEFSTDWGTRDLSPGVSFYDPISYHQGTVWPLFTGWTSLSEYRNGRSLSGYAHLMQNADLTWAQDPGAVTELLSGEFFSPLGRSTSHQLWSSAMVISPVIRGLFGVEWDAAANALTVTPNLPADWDHATLKNLPLGRSKVNLAMTREGTTLVIRPEGAAVATLHLKSRAEGAKLLNGALRIPLPAVEAAITHGLPQPGSTTQQLKAIDQQYAPGSLQLTFSAPAQSVQTIFLRVNDRKIKLRIDGAFAMPDSSSSLQKLRVEFGPGTGYVEKKISITW